MVWLLTNQKVAEKTKSDQRDKAYPRLNKTIYQSVTDTFISVFLHMQKRVFLWKSSLNSTTASVSHACIIILMTVTSQRDTICHSSYHFRHKSVQCVVSKQHFIFCDWFEKWTNLILLVFENNKNASDCRFQLAKGYKDVSGKECLY